MATARILNHKSNRYPQTVQIKVDSNDEIIYESKAIPVGSGIEDIKLNTTSPKGEHLATAYFTLHDTETNSVVGTAGAKVKLVVK